MARVFLFRSELGSATQLSCDTVLSAQDTIFHLKIYLALLSFVFLEYLDKMVIKKMPIFQPQAKAIFSPETN